MAATDLMTVKGVTSMEGGFVEDPAPLLVAQYQRIGQNQMAQLPFYHPTMPILAECALFEEQWLGAVLTPWMLSVVVLPGPQQQWPERALSECLALQLPCGNLTFMVSALDDVGQLLCCSLMSPIEPSLTAEQGQALLTGTVQMLRALPVQQGASVDFSRRRLFGCGTK